MDASLMDELVSIAFATGHLAGDNANQIDAYVDNAGEVPRIRFSGPEVVMEELFNELTQYYDCYIFGEIDYSEDYKGPPISNIIIKK